jgi:hypothetical protein
MPSQTVGWSPRRRGAGSGDWIGDEAAAARLDFCEHTGLMRSTAVGGAGRPGRDWRRVDAVVGEVGGWSGRQRSDDGEIRGDGAVLGEVRGWLDDGSDRR